MNITTPGLTRLTNNLNETVNIAAPGVILDLNGHTIRPPAGQRGIVLFQQWEQPQNVIPGARPPLEAKIFNGTVDAFGAEAIYGSDALGCEIDNLHIANTSSNDLAAVFFKGGPLLLSDCRIQCTLVNIKNRHQGPAAVKVDKSAARISRCWVQGGNSALNVGDGSVIDGNVLMHDGSVTNGYGVFTWAHEIANGRGRKNSGATSIERGIRVTNNTIVPKNGRGVILNGWNRALVENNTILSLEIANAEFGKDLNPCGVRVRYECKDIVIRNNTTLGIAGGGWCAASGYYSTTAKGSNAQIHGNTLMTCLIGPGSLQEYASALALEGAMGDDRIFDNELISNGHGMHINGYDGYSVVPTPIRRCAFRAWSGKRMMDRFRESIDIKLARQWRGAATDAVNDVLDDLSRFLSPIFGEVPLIRTDFFAHTSRESATLENCTFDGVDITTTNKFGVPRTGEMVIRVDDRIIYKSGATKPVVIEGA